MPVPGFFEPLHVQIHNTLLSEWINSDNILNSLNFVYVFSMFCNLFNQWPSQIKFTIRLILADSVRIGRIFSPSLLPKSMKTVSTGNLSSVGMVPAGELIAFSGTKEEACRRKKFQLKLSSEIILKVLELKLPVEFLCKMLSTDHITFLEANLSILISI